MDHGDFLLIIGMMVTYYYKMTPLLRCGFLFPAPSSLPLPSKQRNILESSNKIIRTSDGMDFKTEIFQKKKISYLISIFFIYLLDDPDNCNQDSTTTPPSSASIRPQISRSSGGYQDTVPMPTLYNGSDGPSASQQSSDGQGRIGVLLYNMASMLAGVAVGYDVRLSNVSPFHPKLYPKR